MSVGYLEDYSHYRGEYYCFLEESKWKRKKELREQPRPVRNSVCAGYHKPHYTRQQHK